MTYITIQDYNRFKDYIHSHNNDCIDHYRHKNMIHLPAYHGCEQLIKTALENLSTTEGEVSVFIQQIKDIGGKQNQNTE